MDAGAAPAFDWRPATPADVAPLAALYADAAARLGPRVYTPEQVEAWSGWPARDPEAFRRYVLDADTWVACGPHDEALGFCGIARAGATREVHALYVRAGASRQGIGSAMLRRTLERAGAAGARRFHAWVTPFSRPVFLRCGFAWTLTVREPFAGVMFERYRVERG
jgi:GNAT superfamily N-acetyltransferase